MSRCKEIEIGPTRGQGQGGQRKKILNQCLGNFFWGGGCGEKVFPNSQTCNLWKSSLIFSCYFLFVTQKCAFFVWECLIVQTWNLKHEENKILNTCFPIGLGQGGESRSVGHFSLAENFLTASLRRFFIHTLTSEVPPNLSLCTS